MRMPNGYTFKGFGKKWTATKTTTTDLDQVISSEREITHIQILLNDQHADDTLVFQIVDVDGVYYPANTVLDQFADSWQVDDTVKDQGVVTAGYPATVFAGLYIRIKYVSVGTVNNVTVRTNYYLHSPPA